MKTIGKLAKELDINVETVRFYERKGIIVQPPRPDNGYRIYDKTHINQLKFILKAKALGFTLDEIASLMSMSGNCADVESMGLHKLELIRDLRSQGFGLDAIKGMLSHTPDGAAKPFTMRLDIAVSDVAEVTPAREQAQAGEAGGVDAGLLQRQPAQQRVAGEGQHGEAGEQQDTRRHRPSLGEGLVMPGS